MVDNNTTGAATSTITTHYVVEHFEEELSDWTLSEYIHMILTLNKMYVTDSSSAQPPQTQQHKEVLVLTNFPFVAKLQRDQLDEDELGTKRNTQKFQQIISKPCFRDSVMVSERAFQDLTTATADSSSGGETYNKDHSKQLSEILQSQITGDLSNICFMDMRATQVLQPSERDQFRFVVFGGILGDHPPQDRAKEFRETFSHIRQLGDVQMTTDTAVLVSHAILGQQKAFGTLPFVDEPTIPMDDNIHHFLDISMPLSKLTEIPDEITDFKAQIVDSQLREEARVVNEQINLV